MITTEMLFIMIIIAGLANYKAAHMISQDGDDGPFDVFKRFRQWVGEENWLGRGFHCFSCVSFWGALVATLLFGYTLPINLFVLAWGAVATISFILWRYFG
jgi:hypothetical protein